MTHVISVLNMKGGVGKTTTTVMLGEFLAGEFGKKVLLIDMDPQISLSITMVGELHWALLNEAGRTMEPMFMDALFTGKREPKFDVTRAVQRNASNVKTVTDLDLLPSSYDVIPLQRHLAVMSVARRSPIKAWDILGPGIASIVDDYDYVLIDCPPSLEVMTMNALRISQGYVIPTIPDVLSTYGIPLIQEQVGVFAAEAGFEAPRELGIIVTKHVKNSPVHRGQIAGAAEDQPYGTLKIKCGPQNFKTLWELTEAFRQRVEEGE